jgi:hypothetical protein
VGRVGVQLFETAADLEEVQEFRSKTLGGDLRRKRAEVISPIFQQAASGIAAWEAVTQVKLEKGRRFEAQAEAVLAGVILLVEKIIQPLSLKSRPYNLPFNPAGEPPQAEHARVFPFSGQ